MNNKPILIFVFAIILLSSCKPLKTLEITDRPIPFDSLRTALSSQYMKEHYDLNDSLARIEPKMIVLHWTAIPTLEKSFQAFENTTLPDWRPEIASAGSLNVSAHFLIDKDGTIYRLMPENIMARHVIGLNHCAIGIENVGGVNEKRLTHAQIRANIWLVKYLSAKYPIEYLIGHYEYPLFDGHPLWLEKDSNYRTEKTDPGISFMRKVRKGTKDLHFKSNPNK